MHARMLTCAARAAHHHHIAPLCTWQGKLRMNDLIARAHAGAKLDEAEDLYLPLWPCLAALRRSLFPPGRKVLGLVELVNLVLAMME